jgi:F-type H+-transporting ATPase subunit delta
MTTTTHHETVMDPTAQRLAQTYAEALLASVPADQTDVIAEELAGLVEVMGDVAELSTLMAMGVVTRAGAGAMLDKAIADQTSTPVRAVVASLSRRGRLEILPLVAQQFVRVADRQAGKVEAILTSAHPLSETQRTHAIDELTKMLDAPVVLHPRVDPRLIGGAVVQVAGITYDASVRAQLKTLADKATDRFEQTTHEEN